MSNGFDINAHIRYDIAMSSKTPWNKYEQALLLSALIKVLNHEIDRKQAIAEVSKELRKLAVMQGLDVDDKFRNENGIALQMSKLEYVLTNGKNGLPVDTGWYFSIVFLYKNDHEKYMKLLGEVMDMSASDKEINFFDWEKIYNPDHADEILSSFKILNIFFAEE